MPSSVEKQVIALIHERLEKGFQTYGRWQLRDGRNLLSETLEEMLDACIYIAVAIIELREKIERGRING